MALITKHDGDVQGTRKEDDLYASTEKATSNIDYIAMMEDIDLSGDDTVEGGGENE